MARVNRGELLTGRSRDRFLLIMRQTETNTLLPQGLEKEAVIAHKTGDIRTVLGDVGLVDMPNGKQYIAAVLVKRLDNDAQARNLIQQISRTAYQHLKWYEPKPKAVNEVKPNATP
jgi:beta-lactamase class A